MNHLEELLQALEHRLETASPEELQRDWDMLNEIASTNTSPSVEEYADWQRKAQQAYWASQLNVRFSEEKNTAQNLYSLYAA